MTRTTLRDTRGRLTQEELADLSGVDQTTISNIENGRIKKPSWETVARLSAALGVEPVELFPVDDMPQPPLPFPSAVSR
jgi:transcriptional regulator with XRE-family HTH domain